MHFSSHIFSANFSNLMLKHHTELTTVTTDTSLLKNDKFGFKFYFDNNGGFKV